MNPVPTSPAPGIAIVVPVFNEADNVAPLVAELARVFANVPDPWEIILVDDCSTDLALRGAPVFRSLVGPMPEGRNIVRYESPEVFESLTKEWATPKAPRKRVRKPAASRQQATDSVTSPESADGSAG